MSVKLSKYFMLYLFEYNYYNPYIINIKLQHYKLRNLILLQHQIDMH